MSRLLRFSFVGVLFLKIILIHEASSNDAGELWFGKGDICFGHSRGEILLCTPSYKDNELRDEQNFRTDQGSNLQEGTDPGHFFDQTVP